MRRAAVGPRLDIDPAVYTAGKVQNPWVFNDLPRNDDNSPTELARIEELRWAR